MTMNLHPQWVVGFVDGEGCFNIDTHIHKTMKWGLQIQPEFTIVQNEVDVALLHNLTHFFKCGSVTKNRQDHTGTRLQYRVKSVKLIHEHILPFFEKHPLKTKKNVEFDRFRTIVRLMHDGYHIKSLKNFLYIVEKGQNLRVHSLSLRKGEHMPRSQNSKRAAVDEQVRLLKEQLSS